MGEKAVRIFILHLAGTMGLAFSDGGTVRSEPPSLGRNLPAFQATASAQEKGADSQAASTPTAEVSLYQAYGLILLHNPELAAYSWELRIRETERLQAGLRMNPEVSLDVEDFAGTGAHTGVKNSQTTVQIGQTLELGGKRAARRNVATRQLEKAGWEYETKRLEILKNASHAYLEVVGAQRGLSFAEDAVRLADKTLETLTLRAKAGRVSVIEEAKFKVAATSARVDLEWAKQRLELAREGLAALWGGIEPTFASAKDEMDSLVVLPIFAVLTEQSLRHPRLAELAATLDAERAVSELENANRMPNLTLRGGYRRLAASNDNALVAGVSMPLPLLNRNQGRILESRHRSSKTEKNRQAAVIELRGQLAEAYKVATTAALEVEMLRTSVLPGVTAAFESATQGYNHGRYGYLEVLDAQKNLVTSRLQYLRALLDHHRAIVELESLTGSPLSPSSMERNQ